jgi:hypothetical protein
VYDIETYKEVFTFSVVRADGKFKKTFSCSKFKNEIEGIFKCLDYLHDNNCYLVGFNSNQFDWPIVQQIVDKRPKLPKSGRAIASYVFELAHIRHHFYILCKENISIYISESILRYFFYVNHYVTF